MPTATATLTPDDLGELELPPGVKQHELSDGELFPVGSAFALHEWIKRTILKLLFLHETRTESGMAFADSMFAVRSDRARIPDVSWVSTERLALIPRENRVIPIAPDIAIEIISDSERQNRAEKKLRDYIDAGVEVWQVVPETETVTIWQGSQGRRRTQDQVITSDRLPGFAVPVAELFRS